MAPTGHLSLGDGAAGFVGFAIAAQVEGARRKSEADAGLGQHGTQVQVRVPEEHEDEDEDEDRDHDQAGRLPDAHPFFWLQAFDNQPAVSLPLHALDYSIVIQWLDTILELDPEGDYPMLAAARIYGSVSDQEKKRVMMDYIYDKFRQDPNKHWRWLANAVIVAKHQLKDMPLALKYAEALAESTTSSDVPFWAKDMKIIVLEDMGEIESARVLVGGLIASGEITDPNELNFLENKIRELEEKLTKSRQDVEL